MMLQRILSCCHSGWFVVLEQDMQLLLAAVEQLSVAARTVASVESECLLSGDHLKTDLAVPRIAVGAKRLGKRSSNSWICRAVASSNTVDCWNCCCPQATLLTPQVFPSPCSLAGYVQFLFAAAPPLPARFLISCRCASSCLKSSSKCSCSKRASISILRRLSS